jgi:acetone carboxylase gamma subunit
VTCLWNTDRVAYRRNTLDKMIILNPVYIGEVERDKASDSDTRLLALEDHFSFFQGAQGKQVVCHCCQHFCQKTIANVQKPFSIRSKENFHLKTERSKAVDIAVKS